MSSGTLELSSSLGLVTLAATSQTVAGAPTVEISIFAAGREHKVQINLGSAPSPNDPDGWESVDHAYWAGGRVLEKHPQPAAKGLEEAAAVPSASPSSGDAQPVTILDTSWTLNVRGLRRKFLFEQGVEVRAEMRLERLLSSLQVSPSHLTKAFALGEQDFAVAERADSGERPVFKLEASPCRTGSPSFYVVLRGGSREGPFWSEDALLYRSAVRGYHAPANSALLPGAVGRRLASRAEVEAYWAGASLGAVPPPLAK